MALDFDRILTICGSHNRAVAPALNDDEHSGVLEAQSYTLTEPTKGKFEKRQRFNM